MPRAIISAISKDVIRSGTAHQTRGNIAVKHVREIVESDPILLKKIISMFYYDYAIFGFEMPLKL